MIRPLVLSTAVLLLASSQASAQFAKSVVAYSEGAAPSFGFKNPSAALGEPQRDTDFGAVTPFNPPFGTDDLVSIGEGGQITLRLSHYAIPQAGLPEIGVFTNVGFVDVDFPNGQAGDPAETFGQAFGIGREDNAVVEVSADGQTWVSLGDRVFDMPTSGYTDAAFTQPSDFQQPFSGVLSDFDGLDFPGMLSLLGGSGGGVWLDISATGLPQVGFIRFSLPDDLDSGTALNFDLDAVAISHAAVGAVTTPEPASLALLLLAAGAFTTRRHG